jgi:hypothetical protein
MGSRRLAVPWTWATARCRGTSHVRDGTPCQDALRCIVVGQQNHALVAVVSDGAGSANFGGRGSTIISRGISEHARSYFATTDILPSDDELWSWLDSARDCIGRAAKASSSELREYAATLVGVLATASGAVIVHVGDGAAVLRIDGSWRVPSWPASGEYASTTYFVTDEPAPQLRITRIAARADAVAVFSDGIERLALQFRERSAHTPFFEGMFKPLWASTETGKDTRLSADLKRYLNGEAVNSRTDDDKSLILAARQ